jgi:hypothetical protein
MIHSTTHDYYREVDSSCYDVYVFRARTKKVYTMYSRKPAVEVWQHLLDLKVDYVILEDSWCVRRSKPGCGMAEVWDLEDEVNQKEIPICSKIKKNPSPHFKRVFANNVYEVLQVNKSLKKGSR